MTTGAPSRRSEVGAAPPSPTAGIRFPPFWLDIRGGRLLRGTEAIPLRPKTWAVLRYLAERPGVLVSKRELMDAVWSDVSVTESVMSKSIGELRVALGDGAKKPRLIETIHRRGFRFIAEVGVEASTAVAIDEPASPSGVFVGRAKELERLHAALERAHGGRRQTVFVTGSAGIGKSALTDAFLASPVLRQSEVPVWTLRGTSIEQHGPREAYMPVLEALGRATHHPDGSRLTSLLRRVAPTWLAQMPWLVRPEEAEALRQGLQGVTSQRMLRELAVLVESLTTDVTVVLVLEDLHWSDPSTVDLLSMLSQRPEAARLLVIGTFRPADAIVGEHVLMSAVRTLHMRRRCVELPLDDLTQHAVTAYLNARFPDNDFGAALAQVIHAHTDGNPLFMSGVVDDLLSRGLVVERARGWTLELPLEQVDLGVPADVRLLIEAKFRGMGPVDRALVQAASVAGSEFTPSVVAAALECDVADTALRCDAFGRARRFLRVVGPDRSVGKRYAFNHELYRQVVYRDIPEALCTRLHARIGQALEEAYGARRMDIAGQLAMHFERAHDPTRALHYYAAAAARARARFASREAIGYLEPALALVALLPDDDERRRRELDLRLLLGAALSELHGFASDRVGENYALASELCTQVGTPAQLFEILYARWYFHGSRGERELSIALAERLGDLARRLRRAEYRARADSVSMRMMLYDGRFRECAAALERSFRNARRVTPAVGYGAAPSIVTQSHYALCIWFLGHSERALTTARAALTAARELGHAVTEVAVLMQVALAELLARNVDVGGELATRAIALSAEHGLPHWGAMALVLSGWASVQRGEAAEGAIVVERGLNAILTNGARIFSGFSYGFLAEGHLCSGAIAEGLAAVDAGLTTARTTLDRAYEPELWRLRGELLQATRSNGDPDEAERCLLRALELSRAVDAKSLELRAAVSVARAWAASGRAIDASMLLADSLRWFDGHAESVDLTEARAVLAGLTAR